MPGVTLDGKDKISAREYRTMREQGVEETRRSNGGGVTAAAIMDLVAPEADA